MTSGTRITTTTGTQKVGSQSFWHEDNKKPSEEKKSADLAIKSLKQNSEYSYGTELGKRGLNNNSPHNPEFERNKRFKTQDASSLGQQISFDMPSSTIEKKAGFSKSIISEKDRQHFKTNKHCISTFPENNKKEGIKSFDGQLCFTSYGTSGFTGYLSGYAKGTTLVDTVPVIRSTLLIAEEKFEAAKQTLTQTKMGTDIRSEHNLKTALNDECLLLKGLSNITATYIYRYPKNDHPGMKELGILHEETRLMIDKHRSACQELLGEVPHEKKRDFQLEMLLSQLNQLEQASSHLLAYCNTYNPELAIEKVKLRISWGRELVQELIKQEDRAATREDLVNLTWLLMYYAIQKNEGFHEGSFIIMGGERLFAFLQSSEIATSRPSTHCAGRSSSSHHGIDLPDAPLPASKRTLLFAMVDLFAMPPRGALFFKPENFGTSYTTAYGYDIVMHGWETVKSLSVKLHGKGEDDLPGMRKERVPKNAKDAFSNLVKYINEHPKAKSLIGIDFNEADDLASKWGIAYMRYVMGKINEHHSRFSPELQNLMTHMVETVKDLDYQEIRTGREVILSFNELIQFAAMDENFVFS